MALYIPMTLLVIFMAYHVNTAFNKKNIACPATSQINRQEMLNRVLVLGIFFILFAVSALRLGIGNDYWEYRNRFIDIDVGDKETSYELGFKWTVLLFYKWFGRDNYRTIFALYSFLTCAFFVKGLYDNAKYFFATMCLFAANGFYFMSFSNVRYYFAFSVVLFALQYLFKKKYVTFILWIVFAAFFHKTVLLVIPVYFLAYVLRWTKKTIWMIPAACLGLLLGRIPIRWLLFKFYPYYEGDVLRDIGSFSPVNIAKCAAILVLCLLFFKEAIKDNREAYTLFNLNLFALVLYCFGTYVPELSRICYYMILGHIFLIPLVLEGIKDRKKKTFFTVAVFAAYFCYFAVFMYRGKSSDVQFLPYLTWLFT